MRLIKEIELLKSPTGTGGIMRRATMAAVSFMRLRLGQEIFTC